MRPFYRLSGGGNDFLALIEARPEPAAEEISALCRRGLSAGADGLFILERSPGGARMSYYNADGQTADLCLNGTRCAVRLACQLGWATDSLTIETAAGPVGGRLVGDSAVALDLPRPAAPVRRTLQLDDVAYSGWQVTVGVPHFVLPWPETLAAVPVSQLGAPLRSHPFWGTEGSNIDFVRFLDRHRIELRTYERGVEAETLACGTGVMAAVAAGVAAGDLQLPVSALTLGGFELRVEAGRCTDGGSSWSLTGDARLVAEGDLHPGALELPPPPRWSR